MSERPKTCKAHYAGALGIGVWSHDGSPTKRGAPASPRLLLPDGGRMLSIGVDEIEWVEAAGNYVQIHTPRKIHLVRHTMKGMEAKLDPARFVRIRPSAIVAVAAVDAVETRPGGDYLVILRDGTRIPSSRSYRARIEGIFGKPARRSRASQRWLAGARSGDPGGGEPATPA